MQKLHLVGITPDLDGLILSTRKGAKSGSFVVAVDGAVLKQLLDSGNPAEQPSSKRNGLRAEATGPRVARPASLLTPREMQDLLRGGWTLEEVAAEAGVDVDWVGRFAAPVHAEIRRILDHARELVFDKPRVGPSALRLGPSVRRNVAERGIRFTDDDFDDCWRAWQLDEITWIIEFEYQSRGRSQLAEWTLDLDSGELVSRNRLGTQLGHVQSTRRKISTAPPPKAKPKAAAVRAVARTAPPPAPARTTMATTNVKVAPTPAPKRARTRQSATRATTASASSAKSSKPPAPAAQAERAAARSDPWRDELRRREAERATPAMTRQPPAEAAKPERAAHEDFRPVVVVGPTVRMLARRPPRAAPASPRPLLEEPDDDAGDADDESWPELEWSVGEDKHGPLPAPGPVVVPPEVREQIAAPLGTPEPLEAAPPAARAEAAAPATRVDPVEQVEPVEPEPAEPEPVEQVEPEPVEPEPADPVEQVDPVAPEPAERDGDPDGEPWVPPSPVRAKQPVFRGAEPARAAARPRRREPLRGR